MPKINVGDHVRDKGPIMEEGKKGKTDELVVVEICAERAKDKELGDSTVADFNPGYPEDDVVYGCVYSKGNALNIRNLEVYYFPRTRLELVRSLE